MDNPYTSPNAELSGSPAADQTYDPRMFAWKGRIGRLRYLAYLSVGSIASMFVIGLVTTLGAGMMAASKPQSAGGLMAFAGLLYLPLLVYSFALARRRFNDLDRSGWLAVLMLVPFLNFFVSLYLVFASGTEGPNDYGLPPSKNSKWVVAGGMLMPLIAIVGILAAVAIPAYQGYVHKAQQRAGSADSRL